MTDDSHQLHRRVGVRPHLLIALAVVTAAGALGGGVAAASPPVDDQNERGPLVQAPPLPVTELGSDTPQGPAVAAPESAPPELSAQSLGWFPLGGPYAVATPRVLPAGNLLVEVAGDGSPYVHERTNGTWSGPLAAGGLFKSTVAAAAALNQPQPTDPPLFGVGLDDAMWTRTRSTPWQSLGGLFKFSPQPVIFGGVTYVFGIGFDNAVWYRTSTSGWISLGGHITSDLTVTTDGSSLYVLGRGTDEAMWTRRLAGSTWVGWQPLGGRVTSYPSAAFLFNAGYVFAIGADDAVWYLRVQGGSWTGWQPLGGIAASAPGAAEDPNGGVTVFVVGADRSMWSRRLTAGGWSGWQSLGGGFLSSPGASGTQVFGVGLDGWLWGASFI